MSFFEIDKLSVNVDDFELKNISFKLDKGDFLSIIGPSGAGKTVLLKSIIGFYKIKSGHIFLKKEIINDKRIEKRGITAIFQRDNLFPHLNVRQNLLFPLKKRKENNKLIEKMARKVNIEHLLDRKIEKLSGGEKQRIAIARAFLAEPQILLMDEPFSALDALSKKCLRNLMKDIRKDYNTTIIEVTHNLDDALILTNKVGFINNGVLQQFGNLNSVFDRPKNNFIANFLNTTVYSGKIIEKKKCYSKVKINGTILISEDIENIDNEVKVFIRPENICILKEKSSCSVENVLKCKLIKIYDERVKLILILKCGEINLIAKVKKVLLQNMQISLNQEVFCLIAAENIKLRKKD